MASSPYTLDQLPVEVLPIFRVTEYRILPGIFTGVTLDFVLENPLKPDYFVIFNPSCATAGTAGPNLYAARVIRDPYGGFQAPPSGSSNVIRFGRGGSGTDWVGTVTVVECLQPTSTSGFTLKGTMNLSLGSMGGGTGTQQFDFPTGLPSVTQVVPVGGLWGGGMDCTDAGTDRFPSVSARLTWNGTQLRVRRWAGAPNLVQAANLSVFLVQWGTDWTVQRADIVTGSPVGGADLNVTGEFTTAAITSVVRSRSWLWTSGGIVPATTPAGQFVLCTLGDGVNQNTTEATVAAGAWSGTNFEITPWVLTHSKLSTHWTRIGSDSSLNPEVVAANPPRNTEGYRLGATVWMTTGSRLALVGNGVSTTTPGTYTEALLFPILTTPSQLGIFRADDNGATAVTAWVQEVDLGFLTTSTSATTTPGPKQYVILPDLELTAEAISSVTSESGYRVGPVIPEDTNSGRLFAFHGGDPTSNPTLTYRLASHGDLGEAGWVWQVEGATYWYGWNAADFMWGTFSWNNLTSARYGVVACYSSIYERLLVGTFVGGGSTNLFLRYHSEEDDDPFNSTSIGTPDLATAYTTPKADDDALMRMIELDDGSLRLLVLVVDPDNNYDWDVWGSQDGGDSWTLVASRIVQAANSGTALSTRPVSVAFASAGDWVRVTWADTTATLFHLVSSSRGLAWSYQGSGTSAITTGTNGGVADYYPLAMVGRNDGAGTFILWVRDASNNYEVDAYTVTREDEWVQDLDLDFSMSAGTEVKRLAAATTPDAFFLYALTDKSASSSIAFHARVYDLDDPQGIQRTLATESIPLVGMGKRPHALQLVNAGREMIMVGSFLTWDGTAASTGVLVARLAGWSEVPVQASQNADGWVPTYHWTCLGGQPNSSTYTFLPLRSSGGPTIGCTDLRLQVTTTSGYGYWEWAGGTQWRKNGMSFGALLRVPSSATLTRDRNVGLRVTTAPSGPTGVSFSVSATTTMLALYEGSGGGSLLAYIATPAITQYLYEMRVGLDGPYAVFMAARQYEGVKGWKTRAEGWTRVSGTLLGTAGTTMDLLHWGNLDYSGSGTNTSEWREAWIGVGSSSEPGHVLQQAGMTWINYRGRITSTRPARVYAGIDVFWGGGGGARRDSFAGEVGLAHPRESIFVDSPRFYWQATDGAQQAIVFDFGAGVDPGSNQRRTLHEAAAFFGSRCRTARVEYNWADSWSSPLYTYEADATLLSGMYVRAVDGHAVLVEVPSTAMVPVAAAWEGAYFRLTAGTTTAPVGKTWRVRKHGPARDASQVWLYLESEVNTQPLASYLVNAGDTACVFAPRMAVRYGEPVKTRFMRIVLPAEDVGVNGQHALGAFVAGPVHDFDPPLDWTWKDNQEPNTTRFTSKSGVTWGYKEGPAQRVWQGRIIGDVTQRNREALRNLLRVFSSFDVRPVALVIDHANLPAQLLYGYVSTGGQLDNEGWFTGADKKWVGSGDSAFQLVEVV